MVPIRTSSMRGMASYPRTLFKLQNWPFGHSSPLAELGNISGNISCGQYLDRTLGKFPPLYGPHLLIQIWIRIQSSWIQIRIQEKRGGFRFSWTGFRSGFKMPGFAHHWCKGQGHTPTFCSGGTHWGQEEPKLM